MIFMRVLVFLVVFSIMLTSLAAAPAKDVFDLLDSPPPEAPIVVQCGSAKNVPSQMSSNVVYAFPIQTHELELIDSSPNAGNTGESSEPNDSIIQSILRSNEIPTETWNFMYEGKRPVSGRSVSGEDLYSKYRFAGATDGIYEVYLENKHDSYNLVVEFCRAADGKVLDDISIPAGESSTYIFTTSNVWYLKICGSSYFSGYVDA